MRDTVGVYGQLKAKAIRAVSDTRRKRERASPRLLELRETDPHECEASSRTKDALAANTTGGKYRARTADHMRR